LLKEKAKSNPEMKKLKKLAKELVASEYDDIEFLGETNDKIHKEVKAGARCYKYAKWN
jgi:hypothetical protein